MFIELTDLGNNKVFININSIQQVEPGYLGAVVFTSRDVNTYKETYEEVKNMIDALTAPKLIMPACGGICED